MIRNKRFWGNYETRQRPFKKDKKGQLVILMCIGLIAIVAFTMMDIQSASADPTETVYCDSEDCHLHDEPTTWISLTVDSQTATEITYQVTGSDVYDGEEGWAVFDPMQNNVACGFDSGSFTIPADDETYRVFWVDNSTDEGPGSAYQDITRPGAPSINGENNGKTGTEYTYGFTSTDPDGDDIAEYIVTWGDGTSKTITGPFASGEKAEASHTWDDDGTYEVKATAIDVYGAESDSGTLEVTMPRNKAFNFNFNLLERLFERFPNMFPVLRYLLGI